MEEEVIDKYAILWRIEDSMVTEIAISSNDLQLLKKICQKLKEYKGGGYRDEITDEGMKLIEYLEEKGLCMSRSDKYDEQSPYYPEIDACSIIEIKKIEVD